MIKSNFEKLRHEKIQLEKRKLPLRTIADETGLSLGTIQRLNKGSQGRFYLSTLDKLCCYFGVGSISDLIEYTSDVSKAANPDA